MGVIAVILICCIPIVSIMYGIYMYWQWKNPYTDEPVDEQGVYNSKEDQVATVYRYKRTWKNGKVTYITKKISAN